VAAKETLADAVPAIRGRSLWRGRSTGLREWPIWELPRWVIGFVVLVVLTDAVVLGVEASRVSIHLHDLGLFAALLIAPLTMAMTVWRRTFS
jgi:cytochrome c oxidase assembly factor CtaG